MTGGGRFATRDRTMDYFGPALRELRRIFLRLIHRVRLEWFRRKLAAAEAELGLLGWQQADFDETTQTQVDKVHDVEREQARLNNASAELAGTIRELTGKRENTRREHEAQRQHLVEERARVRQPLAALEPQLAALRKHEPDYRHRIPELDREQRELDELYSKVLLAQPQTSRVHDELLRLRERLIAIPNEKADLLSQHMRISADLQTKEKEAAEIEAHIATLDRQLRELEHLGRTMESKLAAELREKEREKGRLELDVEKLERAKRNPYREIGRVLADANVPPRNQPHVLAHVKELRFAVQEEEYEIARSLQLSGTENHTETLTSWILWGIILIALGLLVGVLF